MSDSVRPHRRQPTRLRHPWDSPGKNTGVGCHFLLQCMKVKSESEVAQSCLTQRPRGLQPTRLLRPWDFLGVLEWGATAFSGMLSDFKIKCAVKSHGRRGLVGCSPYSRDESDTTERLLFHFILSCIGEGNGNPLPCSCLENPRDGGAW